MIKSEVGKEYRTLLNVKKQVDGKVGGAEGGRTPDLGIANAALCQTELLPHKSNLIIKIYCQSVKRKNFLGS